MTKKTENRKYRVIELIIWEEHWSDIWDLYLEIDSLKVPALLSPLHDRDIWDKGPNKGKNKKHHWHLLLNFSSTKSLKQIQELSARFNNGSTNQWEEVYSLGGSTEYLWHKNVPEELLPFKPLYDDSQVRSFNGANVQKWAEDKSNKFEMLVMIIRNNEITNYTALIQFLITCEMTYLIEAAGKHAYALNSLFNGLKYTNFSEGQLEYGHYDSPAAKLKSGKVQM